MTAVAAPGLLPSATSWRHAWRIAAARPVLFALSMALYTAFYCLPLATGLFSRAIFNTLTHHGAPTWNVWVLIGLMIGAQLTVPVVIFFAVWVFMTFNYLSGAMLRRSMLGWLVLSPAARPPAEPPGETLSRFRDDVFETLSFLEAWIDTGGQLVFAVVALAIMWSVNASITMIVILPMIAIAVITQKITSRIHHYRRIAREATARVTSFIGATFGAVQAVRVAGAEQRILGRLDTLNDARRKAAVQDRLFLTLLETFGATTASFSLGLVLLMAAAGMRQGTFSLGDFTLFASYIGWATAAPRWIGRLLARGRTADVSIGRIDGLLTGAPRLTLSEKAAPDHTPRGLPVYGPLETLTVRGLTFRHPSSQRGVDGVDLTVRRGSFTVITGKVGSGKTTLLRSLIGLLPATEGEIRWNGELVFDPAAVMVPPHCAYTAQSPRLFSETLRDNILMGAGASDDDLRAAVALAILDDDVSQFAAGLETMVGTRGVTLSGGQVQRAAAARMFVRRADLLIFDDASSALDVRTERQFWTRLFASGERTCLAVSHRAEAYRRADQIVVLDEGQVAAVGTLAELLESSVLFQAIWRDVEASSAEG